MHMTGCEVETSCCSFRCHQTVFHKLLAQTYILYVFMYASYNMCIYTCMPALAKSTCSSDSIFNYIKNIEITNVGLVCRNAV
jgi:hypothetical protein